MSAVALRLAAASPADIEAIMSCERRPGYGETVGRWSRDEHLAGMADKTHRYIIARGAGGGVAGFVMLQNVGSADSMVLVRRIAVMEPGRGTGRILLGHAFSVIFGELGAAKAWVRVWPQNARGRALYSAVGMREDGVSEVQRNGAPATMTIMSIDADSYRACEPRSKSP